MDFTTPSPSVFDIGITIGKNASDAERAGPTLRQRSLSFPSPLVKAPFRKQYSSSSKKRKFAFIKDPTTITTAGPEITAANNNGPHSAEVDMGTSEEGGNDMFSKFRVVMGYPMVLEDVPGCTEDLYEFCLSKEFVEWLNKRDPELRYKPRTADIIAKDGGVSEPSKDYVYPDTPTWENSTTIRTCLMRSSGRKRYPGDSAFLWYLVRGVSDSIFENGMLFLRHDAICRARDRVSKARKCLDLWCMSPFAQQMQGVKARTLCDWFAWVNANIRILVGGDGASDVVSEKDVAFSTNSVFSISTIVPPYAYEIPSPVDEIRCLWYMILYEQGYSTGTPDPSKVTQASDNAVSKAFFLHPLCIGPAWRVDMGNTNPATVFTLDREIAETKMISFQTFLGMVTHLHYMIEAKKTCVDRLWKKRMPLIADLCKTPHLKRVLLGLAKIERSKSYEIWSQFRIHETAANPFSTDVGTPSARRNAAIDFARLEGAPSPPPPEIHSVPNSPTDSQCTEMALHILDDQKRRRIKTFRI